MPPTTDYAALAAALGPITSRARVDVTAVKRNGRQAWTKEALTPERLERHLNGGPPRGVGQIQAGTSVTLLAVLDFDSHGGEVAWPQMLDKAADVARSIELMGGAPILFRSSGGRGIHVYCLWDTAQDAYSVREWLRGALESCGLRSGSRGLAAGEVELFPKQDAVAADGFGTQVILPLAGASVPIKWEPLAGTWRLGSKSDVLGLAWPVSDDVPRRTREPRPAVDATAAGGAELAGLRELLDAIPNAGDGALGYDDWRTVVFAIHHETAGSDAGLALAHAFSAKSTKYDATFLDERVWPYVHSEGRGSVVGLGSLKRMAGAHGWHEKLDESMFDVIDEDAPAQVSVKSDDGAPPAAPGPKPVERRGIPEAKHLTTDQANANRLHKQFGSQVIVVAGAWHVWDGRRWARDESEVYRYGCHLSGMIHTEAKRFRGAAAEAIAGDAVVGAAAAKKLIGIAEALEKWAARSEMGATLGAALGLVRKMLTVDAKLLDRDPMLLNCLNGTVDLRTGVLRKHAPSDYITKIAGVRYVPGAACLGWEQALREIAGEAVELPAFLQRWFGYCATGETREQVFAVHWGSGENGKSTVLDTVAGVLGDYATTAAPGLLMASKGAGERHPTEIAALFGQRMVTAHESGEGVVLREDFIKQATGSDRITARHMREDFFTFAPTHKLQLLTNHKPQIKGTDRAIWRRVLLVPWSVTFGTEAQVAAGDASRVKDELMPERLRLESEGVLAWIVRGAVDWARSGAEGGLQAPAVVREASAAYKSEQDRIGQFVAECCELDGGPGPGYVGAWTGFQEPLTDGLMGGLYPAFVSWCKDSGVFPVSKVKFADEILRVVPGGDIAPHMFQASTGKRREVRMVRGVKLLPE